MIFILIIKYQIKKTIVKIVYPSHKYVAVQLTQVVHIGNNVPTFNGDPLV
jgi:hypothetical protein